VLFLINSEFGCTNVYNKLAARSLNALVLYASSPIHSDDDEENWGPPPKGQGFFDAKPVRDPIPQEEGTRSPPSKRARQGTIGARNDPNIMKEVSDIHLQQQSTCKSSQGLLRKIIFTLLFYSFVWAYSEG